ncbi:MAG TPA: heavy metal-binding domain-containing protein [Fimbriimonadaceae bacterium]|nr:heavy metal-binding domain-containing protein [Fimbriimonadaceae bacterium]
MDRTFRFFRKQGLTLSVLVIAVFVVHWFVTNRRAPGSMTVVEAQAMDMTQMKAPTGTFPVGADTAQVRMVGGTETFPATVVAYSDEDVVARVPGLVKDVLVYPGDRVAAGQLLATLEADDITAQALAQTLSAQAMESSASGAQQTLAQKQASLERAKLGLKAADANVSASQAELDAAVNHVGHYKGESAAAEAQQKQAQADLAYAKLDYKREQQLFAAGAISRDELDKAQRAIDVAQAKVDEADAVREQVEHQLGARQAEQRAAESRLEGAKAGRDAAVSAVSEAQAAVKQAQDNATASSSQALSAKAHASSANALSSYTHLRATDAGVVTDRLVSPGTAVTPGTKVLKIKVDRELRVQADLPQRLNGSVTEGSAVRLSIDGKSYDAKITSVFAFVEGNTRSFRVEALIQNPGHAIQSGSYAEMEVATSQPTEALSVDRDAVKTASDGSQYVWLVSVKPGAASEKVYYTCTMHTQVHEDHPGDCPICGMKLVPMDATGKFIVKRQPVKVGPSDSRYTIVLQGLKAGDQVTYAGDGEIFPGAAVAVVEWGPDGPKTLPSGGGKSSMPGMDMPSNGDQKVDKPSDDGRQHAPDMKQGSAAPPPSGTAGVTMTNVAYTCKMHPQVRTDKPGRCPECNMTLVPIELKGS